MDDTGDKPLANGRGQTNGVNGTDYPSPPEPNGTRPNGISDDDDDAQDGTGMDWNAQEGKDDEDIEKILDPQFTIPADLENFGSKVIDQGDKDADAIDFEDISDDDLPSDTSNAADPGITQVPGLTEDDGTSHENNNFDELFGDGEPDDEPLLSSPPPNQEAEPELPDETPAPQKSSNEQRNITDEDFSRMSLMEKIALNFPKFDGGDTAVGNWVDQTNKADPNITAPPQNEDELVAQKFPSFKKHKHLSFNQLFPQWPAEYMYKEPPTKDKDPPEFMPTKLELELDADQSKLFKISDTARFGSQLRPQQRLDGRDAGNQAPGAPALDVDDTLSEESDSEDYKVGGFTLGEIATICDDWNAMLQPADAPEEASPTVVADEEDDEDDWMREYMQPKPKKRRYEPGLPDISSYKTTGLDDFMSTTRRSARHVPLYADDPYLLTEDVQSDRPAKRVKLEEKTKRMASGQLGRDPLQYYNISNDAAYEMLKNNHKSKVRAVLSNRPVEHSMPALKLTYPFYRTKVAGQFWEHHRKKLDVDKIVKHAISVRKPGRVKKKDWKNKSVAEIFKTSKDLSLNDNSTAVLFEYSEQYPILLSNFGMGNRIINYYRKKDQYDDEKPAKLEMGESHNLLPEDRSPFSIFGTVDPGETVPTLHNTMYRAPIYKHEARKTDFLLGYSTSATEGSRFYLRPIDHVYAVGQAFPSLEVPGPHARKVTNTTKNRLKMVSYRIMKHKPTEDVTLPEITPHVFERHDPQNRQKMKEFLSYDRDRKVWVLREGETMLDEAGIRSMIKPEDVCLIESMQVGNDLLRNAGFDPKNKEEDDDEGDDHTTRMAPWRITRNFLDASAGKAMVALHGEGDPTGHGLGFSFIKTSMKGGYINAVQGPLATSADAMERERKANGGHAYNVKEQNRMYQTAIHEIWERQKATLSDPTQHEDTDVLDTTNEDDRFDIQRQMAATPAPAVEDGRSQITGLSGATGFKRQKLKITRKKQNEAGEIVTETVFVDDPVIIRNYTRHRAEMEELTRDVYSFQPSADADANRENMKLVEKELARLLKNQDRRQVREKQGKSKKKATNTNGDPDPSSADKASAGTTRKCANCGQVGHIKTNKSKCPLLNGTISTNNEAADNGGFGSFSAPTAGPSGAE